MTKVLKNFLGGEIFNWARIDTVCGKIKGAICK